MRVRNGLLTLFIFSLFTINLVSQNVDTVLLYFQIDSYNISGENVGILNELSMKSNIRDIKISGFTDFLGSYDHNQQLSQKRAESVKDFLISKSIEENKILSVKGLGIHQFSSFENRRNSNDRGIHEHRKVEIIYVYDVVSTVNNSSTADNNSVNSQTNIIENNNQNEELAVEVDLRTITEDDLIEGNKILLKNINFVGGTPKFLPESDEALKQLLEVMKKYPNLKIEIQGHICCQTEEEGDGYDYINDNHTLSFNRARAVFEYLRNNGISGDRMTYVGFASKYKLYPLELDEYEKTQNRRVEIKIIEK
ncbi:MAG: OmpA family protein [Bacteroidales bacterium]|nr:OmpA family protein [Bacteroidales bacterium]